MEIFTLPNPCAPLAKNYFVKIYLIDKKILCEGHISNNTENKRINTRNSISKKTGLKSLTKLRFF